MKIIGDRGCGKTEHLINIANTTKYVLVEPNFHMAENVKARAKQKDCEIRVITATEFFYDHIGRRDEKYLVDELDMFLKSIGIRGYSDGLRDNEIIERLKEQEPKKIKDHYIPSNDMGIESGECPSCGKRLPRAVYPVACGYCGQLLKWPED